MHKAGIPLGRSATRPIVEAIRVNREQFTKEAFEHLQSMRKDDPDREIPTAAMDIIIEATATSSTDSSGLPTSASENDLVVAIDRYKHLHRICRKGPSINTFNALFAGCIAASPGQKATAMFMASELRALKIAPNAATYDLLILVCLADSENAAHVRPAGNDEECRDALRYYHEMRRRDWLPRRATLERLIMRCARIDRGKRENSDMVQEAGELVQTMEKKGMSTNRIKGWLRDEFGENGARTGNVA